MKSWQWLLVALLVLVGLSALAVDWAVFASWSQYHFGFRNGDGNSPHYLFYSGFGSIIIPPVLNGLFIGLAFWWHHQCAVTGCLRYARRTTAAGERACWVHHPERKVTVHDLHLRHHMHRHKCPVEVPTAQDPGVTE